MVVETIYVDESGRPGLSNYEIEKYPFFVMGFVFFRDPRKFKLDMQRFLKRLHRNKKYHPGLKELKFYPKPALMRLGCTPEDIQTLWMPHFEYVQKKAIALILRHADGVYAGILDKRLVRTNDWTPESIGNYVFHLTLFKDILPFTGQSSVPEVIYDRGRLGPKNTDAFNKFLNNTYTDYEYLGQRLYPDDMVRFRDEDSKKDPGLWGADLVAGSFRHLHVYNDPTYTDLLQPKFLETGSRIFFLVEKVAGVPTKPSDTSYLSYDTVLVDLHAYIPYMPTFYLCFYKTMRQHFCLERSRHLMKTDSHQEWLLNKGGAIRTAEGPQV